MGSGEIDLIEETKLLLLDRSNRLMSIYPLSKGGYGSGSSSAEKVLLVLILDFPIKPNILNIGIASTITDSLISISHLCAALVVERSGGLLILLTQMSFTYDGEGVLNSGLSLPKTNNFLVKS